MNFENMNVVLEGMDENDISSVLAKLLEVRKLRADVAKIEDVLKLKARAYLEERQWDNYTDDNTKTTVKIIDVVSHKINKVKLKDILNKTQFEEVTDISRTKRMTITSEEDRKRMKRFMKK